MHTEYDYIMLGGGAAALMLAYAITQSNELKDKRLLIIDPVVKNQNDRTWCYWHASTTPFDHLAAKKWPQVSFKAPKFEAKLSTLPLHYYMLKGIDFYEFIQKKLQESGQVEFLQDRVSHTSEQNGYAQVHTQSQKQFSCAYCFDSRFQLSDFEGDERCISLLQHFKGYLIQTPHDVFDIECPTLFDFNIPQHNEVRFVYTLPLAPNKALIEFTIFSSALLPQMIDYDIALKSYIEENLKIDSYQILEKEKGVIPMSNKPITRKTGKYSLKIGTAAGMAKASTGYVFLRCWRDAQQITASLKKQNHPFQITPTAPRFNVYDSTIMNLMLTRGGQIQDYFTDLFSKNPTERLLRFLDDQTSLPEELLLMSTVPTRTFASSMTKILVNKI
ncbi:MAG: lycopene cyclase [Cytophagales bacterium]|nr:MAG: lycopene cyclase [Cytophagales bacterium]TAF62127.1 MAG: lycopene cyclase [Cytophagales bacterium]